MRLDKVQRTHRSFGLLAALDNRWVSRVSNIVFIVGAAGVGWKVAKHHLHGADLLTLASFGLLALGAVLRLPSFIGYWQRRQTVRDAPRVVGRFLFPRTPLERTIAQQIAAAEAIERERRVRGDGGYFHAVVKWAGETSEALRGANAGNLAVEFDQGGIPGPLTVEKIGDYMAEKVQLLRDALAQLRSDEPPAWSSPARQPDRVGLLRDACKEGKRVQTRLVYLNEPNARFDAVCDWARDTWAMLAEHFPHYSQVFYGPGSEALGAPLFPISCQQEIDTLGGYVERYVEKKLGLLHDLLKQYDVAG